MYVFYSKLFCRNKVITVLTQVKSNPILTLNIFQIWGGALLESGPISGILSIGQENMF